MQAPVLAISLVSIGLIAAAFLYVALTAADRGPSPDLPALERKRAALFWVLVVVGFVATYATLRPWPHDATAADGAIGVDVTAMQWAWEISRKQVPVSTPVVFNVGSADVNHGFGVYDPAGTLLFQTQAMPGVINRVRYTFSEPGVYSILCMEYCGLVHHGMKDEITVETR